MSKLRVASINVDKNLSTPKIPDQETDSANLKEWVSNYVTYMEDKTKVPHHEVPCVLTLSKSDIENLMKVNEDADGIRIYLAKKSDNNSVHSDIFFLVVPVAKVAMPVESKRTTAATVNTPEVYKELAMIQQVSVGDCPTGVCPPGGDRSNFTLL